MIITRQGATVSAFDDKGQVLRVNECRNVAGAIDLELKLNFDLKFAGVRKCAQNGLSDIITIKRPNHKNMSLSES